MTARLVVLGSGSGTNCQALIDACAQGRLDAAIVAVASNRASAGILARGAAAGAAVEVLSHRGSDPQERRAADARLIETVRSHEPDLVVLAGWMRILGSEVGAAFPIVNLHPAKPGEFPGLHAIERAYDAWTAGDVAETGVMVHWVPDAGVDEGPVINTVSIGFRDGESLADFEQRVHDLEHLLIVDGVRAALVERGLG